MRLAEVHELVTAVGGVDLACRDRAALSAAVAAAARLRAWLDGRDVALAAQLEEATSYPEKVLADAARTSLKEAERTVRRVRTTRELPELGEALTAGAVSGAHVDMAGDALARLEPGQRRALIDREGWLVGVAERSTPEAFRRELSVAIRRIQADEGMARLERQRRACRVRTWVDHRDGMWCLSGRFDPETGVRLHARLQAAVSELAAEQGGRNIPAGGPTDPSERQDFLRAHALAALIDGRARGGGRPEVTVVVDVSESWRTGTPVVDWGLPVEVPVAVLRALAGEADVHGVVVAHGVVWHAPGVLDLGRACRVASRAQRRALRGLYATCAVPGCAVRYDSCKLHHVHWWEHGGGTDLDNLLPLCERHHHCVHDAGWTVTLGPRRELTVRMPDGDVMTTGPPRREAA
jgi:hypothetical protein